MGKGGRERRCTGEKGGSEAPLASHPLQEGPGLLHSALALLLKFQLCAQPSWLAASHVPAPGWASGSGARGRHMDKKPEVQSKGLDVCLAQGHKRCQAQPRPALSTAWRPQPLAFINIQGVPAGEAWCWVPSGPGITRSGWPKPIYLDNNELLAQLSAGVCRKAVCVVVRVQALGPAAWLCRSAG